jgi:hypothetical protein
MEFSSYSEFKQFIHHISVLCENELSRYENGNTSLDVPKKHFFFLQKTALTVAIKIDELSKIMYLNKVGRVESSGK